MTAIISSLVVPSVSALLSRPVATKEECEVNALQLQLTARSALALAIDADESVASTSYRLRELVVIPSTATLSMAIDVLTAHRILSAPVIRPDSTCAGVVDMATIALFLLRRSHAAGYLSVDEIEKKGYISRRRLYQPGIPFSILSAQSAQRLTRRILQWNPSGDSD